MTQHSFERRAVVVQRVENGAIAAAVIVLVVAMGQPWWWLIAAFLLFDISVAGYAGGPRLGALLYNAIHSYVGPAILLAGYAALSIGGHDVPWLALVAACWTFHVSVDRALGYGLKLQDFAHTHLGRIGRRTA